MPLIKLVSTPIWEVWPKSNFQSQGA